jgi:hypothetical protein
MKIKTDIRAEIPHPLRVLRSRESCFDAGSMSGVCSDGGVCVSAMMECDEFKAGKEMVRWIRSHWIQ